MRRMIKYAMILLTLIAAAAVTSCGTSGKMTARATHHSGKRHKPQKPTFDIKIDPMLPADTRSLLAEASTWLGVPYAWGGNDRSGVDCSGFVTQVFKNALDIKLPRTSASQSEYCMDIDRLKLQPGDLLFFDTTGSREGRVSHVGLYIGDGNMIHASTSKGVTVSAVDGVYFGSRLMKTGRVASLHSRMTAQSSASPASPAPEAPRPATNTVSVPAVGKSSAVSTPVTDNIDARTLVLYMLVEQKLDSIYSH